MNRDGKNNFFRKLDLDEKTRKLIRQYREIKRLMDKDPERKNVSESD